MPLIGVKGRRTRSHTIGHTADCVAATAVIAIGARMLLHADGETSRNKTTNSSTPMVSRC